MKDSILEQLELERQKRDIIKTAKAKRLNTRPEQTETRRLSPVKAVSEVMETEDGQKYAWEYEIEKYRKDRMKERFYMVGAVCGILSLVINLWYNFPIINIIKGLL